MWVVTFPAPFYADLRRWRNEGVRYFREKILASLAEGSYGLFLESSGYAGASRLLGEEEAAVEYFGYASRLIWPSEALLPPGQMLWSEAAVDMCKAAIMAALAGDAERANRLFAGAVAAFRATPAAEYEQWKPGAKGEDSMYGNVMLFWAYASARTRDWEQVEQRCAEAVESYMRAHKRRSLSDRKLLSLAHALQSVARYVAEPGPEHLKETGKALETVIRKANVSLDRARACGYVWDLEAAFLPGVPSVVLLNQ